MRKVIVFNMVTVDGFFEGPNKEIDWHMVDAAFNDYADKQLKSVDVILFGRLTYEMMASYWPTPAAVRDDPIIAGLMNNAAKIVFSKTLQKAGWQNTRLVREDAAGEVAKLKQLPGKDMFIFGSADLATSLTRAELIDEYRIIVNPIVLGNGSPLFKGLDTRLNLKLLRTQVFDSGNVLLCYEPVRM